MICHYKVNENPADKRERPNRIGPRELLKIKHLNIMKRTILTLAILAAALTGCRSSQPAAVRDTRADISWAAFCAARGYDPAISTYDTINEYLDTWCGSAAEERAFIAAGVKTY